MVVTYETTIPSDEDLTVPEVNVSGVVLRAASFHLGKYCEDYNNEFMLCRRELEDPRKCLKEGKEVTSCSLRFFRELKKSCAQEFTNYYNCIDRSSPGYELEPCRKTQLIFDGCMSESMSLERPPFGYFCEVKVCDSARPQPSPTPMAVYADCPPGLPKDSPHPPASSSRRKQALIPPTEFLPATEAEGEEEEKVK